MATRQKKEAAGKAAKKQRAKKPPKQHVQTRSRDGEDNVFDEHAEFVAGAFQAPQTEGVGPGENSTGNHYEDNYLSRTVRPDKPSRAPNTDWADHWGIASEHVLDVEGGYVDHEADPGGATNHGISLRFLRERIEDGDMDGFMDGDIDRDGDIDAEDIKGLSKDKALELYKKHFWDDINLSEIKQPFMAVKMFDMAVNMGERAATRIMQRAVNSILITWNPTPKLHPLVVDGKLGPITIQAINMIPTSDPDTEREYARVYREHVVQEQIEFYRHLVEQRPSLQPFLSGWENRARSIV